MHEELLSKLDPRPKTMTAIIFEVNLRLLKCGNGNNISMRLCIPVHQTNHNCAYSLREQENRVSGGGTGEGECVIRSFDSAVIRYNMRVDTIMLYKLL